MGTDQTSLADWERVEDNRPNGWRCRGVAQRSLTSSMCKSPCPHCCDKGSLGSGHFWGVLIMISGDAILDKIKPLFKSKYDQTYPTDEIF